MIGKVVTDCVAILPYHTATQDRGSECRDFGFISRIVTALVMIHVSCALNHFNTRHGGCYVKCINIIECTA